MSALEPIAKAVAKKEQNDDGSDLESIPALPPVPTSIVEAERDLETKLNSAYYSACVQTAKDDQLKPHLHPNEQSNHLAKGGSEGTEDFQVVRSPIQNHRKDAELEKTKTSYDRLQTLIEPHYQNQDESQRSEPFDLLEIVAARIQGPGPDQLEKTSSASPTISTPTNPPTTNGRPTSQPGAFPPSPAAEISPVAPPPNLRRGNGQNSSSLPGAYANGGSNALSRRSRDSGSDLDLEPEAPNDEPAEESEEAELTANQPELEADVPVANPVNHDEETALDLLPQAEDIDTYADASLKRKESTKKFQTKILLGSAICGMALVVGLILAFTSSRKDNSQPPTTRAPSASPSMAPTSMQDYLLTVLPNETVTRILWDVDSPQGRAYNWMTTTTNSCNDTAALEYLDRLSPERIQQRFVLATIYFATSGDQWDYNDNWLNHSIHECFWYSRFDNPDEGDKFGALWLGAKHFNPCNQNLTNGLTLEEDGYLEYLWLKFNELEGFIPPEIGMLTRLKSINLDHNTAITGTIPTQLGLLSELIAFACITGELQGTIPTELTRLQQLRFISFFGHQLTGSIPSTITDLSSLQMLYLNQNMLTGTIPTTLVLMTTLDLLGFDINPISGTIPTELGLMTQVDTLSFGAMILEGTIPSELGNLLNLHTLALNDNTLNGTVPSVIGKLSNLENRLNLSSNALSGTIPTELGNLHKVEVFDLSNNNLSGPVPSTLGNLTSVTELNLAFNNLSGQLPIELSWLSEVVEMDLKHNSFTGVVPEPLCFTNITFDCSAVLCGCGSCTCM